MKAFAQLESLKRLKEKFLPGAEGRSGLDIGSSSVRAVEIVDKDETLELVSFGMEPVKAGDRESLIGSITKVVQTAPISAKRVNTSISGQEVIVRYIQLPRMTDEELSSAIRFEAEKYIPFNVSEVILDCQVLGEAEKNMMKVLLVAAKSELISDHIKIVEEAGLVPALIDVDSFAIVNSFQMNNPDQTSGTIALLNIGAGLTNINILKDGVTCFARDIQIAGSDFTEAISEKLGIDLHAAEELKCSPGERSKEILEVISPVLESCLSEVRLSFDYYESEFTKGIDKVYLSGGSARLKGIAEFLSEGLRSEIEVWDPLKSFSIGPDIDRERLAETAPSLAVCVGLALRKA